MEHSWHSSKHFKRLHWSRKIESKWNIMLEKKVFLTSLCRGLEKKKCCNACTYCLASPLLCYVSSVYLFIRVAILICEQGSSDQQNCWLKSVPPTPSPSIQSTLSPPPRHLHLCLAGVKMRRSLVLVPALQPVMMCGEKREWNLCCVKKFHEFAIYKCFSY